MNSWPYPAVFVHRCGGALAPENTLEGLEVAARYAAGVEFDVMLSAEGSPYLIHDETLERTTSGRGWVSDATDATLSALDAGAHFAPRFAGARLPHLRDAAARCIELGLAANVEIKPASGNAARSGDVVARLALALWGAATPPPLLSSFSEDALEAARSSAPTLPRGLLVEIIPADWHARCQRLGASALHADGRCITREQVEAVRAAGLWMVIYTEDDPVRAAQFFEWGVDCIITDRPDLVRRPPFEAPATDLS